jgi:DNA-binding NtrC family response regulator
MAFVLIVEDEEQVLVLAESYLQEHGHETRSADTIEGALAILANEEVDVLFTDIGLRGDLQAGLELAKQARERHPDLRVLYTTGQTVTDGMKALFVEGAKLVEKPYTVDELSAALAVHFGIRPNSPSTTPTT